MRAFAAKASARQASQGAAGALRWQHAAKSRPGPFAVPGGFSRRGNRFDERLLLNGQHAGTITFTIDMLPDTKSIVGAGGAGCCCAVL